MGVSLTGYSMPIFWWGLLLILLFSVQLGLTPVSGRIAVLVLHRAGDRLPADRHAAVRRDGRVLVRRAHLILPTIVLGTVPLAVIARMTRSAMLEVLGEDYIRTATRQGAVAVPRHRPARAAQRADPGRDGDRPAGRRAVHRRDPDRDDLLLAGRRQVADRGDQPARLSGAAGRHAADRRRRHGRQSARRPHLRPDQSAHQAHADDRRSPRNSRRSPRDGRPRRIRCASSGAISAPTTAPSPGSS